MNKKIFKIITIGIIFSFAIGIFLIGDNFRKTDNKEIYNFTEVFVDYLYQQDSESLKMLIHPESRDYFSSLGPEKEGEKVEDLITYSSSIFKKTKPSFIVNDITEDISNAGVYDEENKLLDNYFSGGNGESLYLPVSPEKFLNIIGESEDFNFLISVAELNDEWFWVPLMSEERAPEA